MKFGTKSLEGFGSRQAYLLLFILLLPYCFFINNALIWDDQLVVNTHSSWSLKALLGPYAINSGSYWRPVTQILISMPEIAGAPVWAGKLLGLILFYITGCIAIAIVDQKAKLGSSKAQGMLTLILLLALHPLFAETTLWISAHADLLTGALVLIGIYWLFQRRDSQDSGLPPESSGLGLLRSFTLVWLICGAKDSGLIWTVLGALAVFSALRKSTPAWKKYWCYVSIGILCAVSSYMAARFFVLGEFAESNQISVRGAISFNDQWRFFSEFLLRAFTNIFLPYFDPAPFKSSGWLHKTSPGVLLLSICIIVILLSCCLRWLFRRSRYCGWLVSSAWVVILFYSVIETFIEPTQGSTVAGRYLVPSVILIFISMAILMSDAEKNEKSKACSSMYFGLVMVALILIQSILVFEETRESWRSNLSLWQNSWNNGSKSRLVASNLSLELMNNKKFQGSIEVARTWIDAHPSEQSTLRLCSLYDVLLKDYLSVQDEISAIRAAQTALPVGWCYRDLAQNIAFVLMKQQCRDVLPMLNKALRESDHANGGLTWNHASEQDKINLLSLVAYTEVRCGNEENATRMLTQLGTLDINWGQGGSLAQSLINQARKDRSTP